VKQRNNNNIVLLFEYSSIICFKFTLRVVDGMCALSDIGKKREGKPLFRRRDFMVASFWREGKQAKNNEQTGSVNSLCKQQRKWRKIAEYENAFSNILELGSAVGR